MKASGASAGTRATPSRLPRGGRAGRRQRGAGHGAPALPGRDGPAMKRPVVPPRERGAALLAVLLLVAVTGAIAAAALEKMSLSRAVATNVVALDQARAYRRRRRAARHAHHRRHDRRQIPERTTLDGRLERRGPAGARLPGGGVAAGRASATAAIASTSTASSKAIRAPASPGAIRASPSSPG